MKLKFFFIPFVLLIAITLIISSCAKDGSAGATGPAGPAGPQGSVGAPGLPGSAGPAGTANVIYSDWLSVNYGYNINTSTNDTLGFGARITAPKLVDSILSKGEIKVYFNFGSTANPDIVPLPIFDPIYFNPSLVINPDFFLNEIDLSSNYPMGTDTSSTGVISQQYRYILIPGGVKAGRGVSTINWNDYSQVKAYLKLKD